ncbi:MAG: flagellar hook assembly protein FlgD [Alphaproteobacteria bacterium]|nr:MAG: flagellar hook assembly protein FlgD [Alphaproteobacteria bacterium]
MTSAVGSSTSSASTQKATSASTTSALGSLSGSFDMMLKLLVAQMQNQDPTAPQDANEMTKQLVSFTGVEQQISTNSKLDQLITLQNGSGTTPLLNYIGKTVAFDSAQLPLQQGAASFNYTLPQAASTVQISVMDSTGKVVFADNGDPAKGAHLIEWNGKNAAGTQLADGFYKINITAKDSSGKDLTVSAVPRGQVTAVETDSSGKAVLSIGGLQISADTVKGIYEKTNTNHDSNAAA